MADDSLIDDFRRFNESGNRDAAHANLMAARSENPDEMARTNALAKRWGVGLDAAKRQQPLLEQSARSAADREALASAPGTSRFLAADPAHAAVSHDHVGEMVSAEELAKRVAENPYGALRPAVGPKPTLASYLGGLGTGFGYDWGLMREGVRAYVGDMLGLTDYAQAAARRTVQLQFRKELATPDFKSHLAGSVYGGFQSTLQAVPAIAAGVATRNPELALTLMGSQTGLGAYGKYRARDATPNQALAGGVLEGGIEAGTEMIPMGFLVKRFGKVGFKSFVAGLLAREMPTEQIATFAQDAVDTAIANPDKSWGDFWKERPGAALDTAIAVGVQGLTLGGFEAGVHRMAQRDAQAEATPDQLKAFNDLAKATSALPLRERSPEAFQALMQELAPGIDVHVSAGALTTYLQSVDPQEAAILVQSLGVADQLDAATRETDIVIPAATYLQHIAPTGVHKALEKDIKIGPAGMSLNEAEEHKAEREQMLAEAAQRAFAQGGPEAVGDASAERVRQDFYDKAVAAGVPEAQAHANAVVQAAYYAQRAERNPTFTDAWDAYEKTGIDIQAGGKAPTGDVFSLFKQGKHVPTPRSMLAQVNKSKNKELRGLIAPDGSLHLWDANDAIHGDKAKELGIPYDVEKNDNRVWVRLEDGLPHIELGEGQKLPAEYSGEDLLITAPGLGTVSTREYRAAGFEQRDPPNAKQLMEQVPGLKKVLPYLTDEERAKLKKQSAKALVNALSKMPSAEEMASVAYAGRAKRGWYEKSALAILNTFGAADAPRFAALLAALSPQTSVESNAYNALATWVTWDQAGRPTGRQAIIDVLGKSVQGGKGRESVLGAWINNAVRALSAEDPGGIQLSGPKVSSFMNNLIGVVDEVTNDAWMANYAAIEQAMFKGKEVKGGDEEGYFSEKSAGYMAMSAMVRKAADIVSTRTGEQWTPAEVQETVWSWAKTLYEKRDSMGETTAGQLLQMAGLTHEDLSGTPDFAVLFTAGVYRRILEHGGYGAEIERLAEGGRPADGSPGDTGSVFSAEGAGIAEGAYQRHLLRAAGRIEQRRHAARVARFEQGPVPDQKGMVTLSHFSAKGRIPQLDPDMWGENWEVLPDDEKTRVGEAPGRVYWGFGTGQAGEYQPELGIGEHRYEAQVPLDRLYPLDEDPKGLRAEATKEVVAEDNADGQGSTAAELQPEIATRLEQKVKAAGYLGYWSDNPELGRVAATFEPVKHTYKGRAMAFNQLAEGEPLEGLPRRIKVDGQTVIFGPFEPAREAAREYMAKAGLPYAPPATYVQVDEDRAKRIAQAYEDMKHDPQDPEVKAAYDAMISETLAQWQAIKATGLQVEFNNGEDPYGNPRNAILDVVENNHLFVFPTAEGFGSSDLDVSDNPLLASVEGEDFNGRPVVVNDIFRVVHDYFGHIKEGVGFRADGEENAWRSHSAMYSPLARRAMTTETRGQNSWVNYGPHAEANRTASGADTVYADQKIGLLPQWVVEDGATDEVDERPLQQSAKGAVSFSDQGALVQLFKGRNASTLVHEAAGHVWLDNLIKDAADPNASDEVRADLETVKAWWRANAPEGSNLAAIEDPGNAAVDDIRPFHELFARAAERYFMEGRAPTPSLREVFAKFRQWLVAVYKDFTRLNVPMTPEIREVFDRLIAVPQAVEDAKVEQGFVPLDAAQMGMSPAEHAAYLRTIQLADETAHDRLLGKVMADVRRKYTTVWKAEREALVEEHQETVNELPEMQALALLESGAVRLDRQAVQDLGFDEAQLYRRQRPYVYDEGLHPDVVAEQVGMTSGQALLQKLVDMQAEHNTLRAEGDKRTVRRARAEEMADAEMVAKHGDILNDGTIGDEAVAAIHDMRRSEVMMAEVRALVRKAGALTAVWSPAEMQAWARKQIDTRQLSGIRPHVYEVAEAKAGRDALKALVKDDFQGALDAKFRQLLNMHLYRAARDARDEIDKGKALFDRIAKARNGTITKTRDMDMVSAARMILAGYGFGAMANDTDYMAKVARYDPELWSDLEVGVTAALAGARPVDELTLDQFQSLYGMVNQLWEMSRTSRQMQIDFQALEVEDVANDLGDALGVVVPRPGNHAPTKSEHIMRMASGIRAALRRVEHWVTGLDGGNKGVWRTYIWQPVSEAAARYRVAKADYLTRFVALLEPVSGGLKRGKIEAPELGYTFGFANSGVGKSELLHALLHTGNESNKRKLLLGRGWAVERADGTLDTSTWDRFLDRMHNEGVITQADYEFAQSVWDLLDEMKPAAQQAHRAVFGRYFEEVTANEVSTPFGKFRGGYVPAVVDTFLVQEQALNAQAEAVTDTNDAAMFPSPAKGFTKARVEYNKPLALDLGLLPQHVDKVLKFTHMLAPVRDVLRLLKEKSLSAKLEAFDPVAVPDLLLPWLNRSARQIIETPAKGNGGKAADAFFRAVRTRTGMGIMIANVSNTLQQFTGWLPSTLKVRKRHLTRALWNYTRHPLQMAEDIATMSTFMATRVTSQVHEAQTQIEQLLLDPTKYEKISDFARKHAYVMQSMTQNIVDLVTWQGAFEQATAEGQEYQEAVRFADATIRETQGSLAPEDVSRFETGGAFIRMFTQFYNYFGAQSNLLTTEFKNAKSITRVGYVYIMGIMLPAVVADIIRRSFGEGWDDDDDDGYLDTFLDVFFGSQFRYVTGMLPVAGALVVNMANRFNDKPYDDTIVPAPAFSSAAAVAGLPRDVYKLVTEGKNQKATIRDSATLLTLLSGVPWFNAVARPAGYLADINEGKVEPTSPLDFARGLMTGTASKASKVQ